MECQILLQSSFSSVVLTGACAMVLLLGRGVNLSGPRGRWQAYATVTPAEWYTLGCSTELRRICCWPTCKGSICLNTF